MAEHKSWGEMHLKLRKAEYLKQIQAYIADQLQNRNRKDRAELFGCSLGVVTLITQGNVAMLSLDMLYTIAMNLEMQAHVTIQPYGE